MLGMSKLSDHLRRSGMTQAQFARALGVDQATVSKLCRRKLQPSLQLAVHIERLTDGEVPTASWIATPYLAPEKDQPRAEAS